ncbi:glycerophosphodiester phosphodiesterase family protein [Sphingomonas carotinifaciens]|uniref:Glycerophosphoryl diester phosphodiesterase n=1 Tax=Sphingomonas carotinifaciens TaxID=1166323 RepID=A0A1G7S6H6_9SPHN|nr:glycerophosphodiester phosphodiesterase family protein [Sphingomonas carotinifaciens]MBB4088194.1 glycerophosphoryl diester phosphodiesterase/membrane-associated phospholipid phosphatase [Sphingomonas carotinifaciens]MWC42197.1 phosphatase PAP2 family protein [Sphingomonas carotinifaciens]SDG18079.1 Glycerophosphoryl diester phosphodiesterase [Sphingomonas carotinifaciens]
MRLIGVIALALASTSASSSAAEQRYLSGPGVALTGVLPPPPATGSIEDEADRAAFRATRVQEGSPRWRQAIADVDETIPAILTDFSPAAGRPLSARTTPALARLLTRMRGDVAAAVNAVKPLYARKRPFLIDAGSVCQPRAALERSFDYPSGHTSWGTSVALVLAELIPARAGHILERGRDYGDSRIICGAHNASAVTAGRQAAAAVVARLHGDADFRADLDAARVELDPSAATMRRIADPDAGPIVVAHRGCHAAAARLGLGSVPENSLAALEHCVAIGADVMESDVRMTRDGHLVMIHDATVDRTTNGHGRVSDLTLAELRELRLRDDLGGADAPLTGDRIATLDEMLRAAAGRIVLNLDIKDAVHAETIETVARAGGLRRVLVKANAGIASPPMASLPPFERVPFMPMLSGGAELPSVIERQSTGAIRPVGYEVPPMPMAGLPRLVAAARSARGRVWANTLWNGYVADVGGDDDALRDPGRVWGRLIDAGVSMIQTDHPAELRQFVDNRPSR